MQYSFAFRAPEQATAVVASHTSSFLPRLNNPLVVYATFYIKGKDWRVENKMP
jgi:hypothetical protein